jgi:hypothetical protein
MSAHRILSVIATTICFLCSLHASADIIWVGGTSVDVFDEANWDLSASAVTLIDPNVSIMDDVVMGPGPFTHDPVIPEVSAQQRLQLGDGYTLTVDNTVLSAAGNDGVGGRADSSDGPTVNVLNGAQFNPFFIVNDVQLNIDAFSSATLGGGGNPINLSIVDLAPGATLAFLNEDPAAYIAEHLSKTFVNGVPAVEGGNILVASDGASGSVITAIPEPSTFVLACLAAVAMLVRRRRR